MTAVLTRGIDVSHHNGVINWGHKKSSLGLSFGMAKCVEGTGFFDPQYVANREGCHLAGMPFIAYGYVRPEAGSALAQARYLIEKAGQVEGLCMDLEVSALTQAQTNAWMRSYGDNLRALAPRVTTFAYLGGYAANGSGQSAVNHFDRWIYPHYTVNVFPTLYAPRVGANTTGWAAPPAPHMWQCSDNVAGTDADVSDLTLSQLFSGDDMPITQADADLIARTMSEYQRDTSGPKTWQWWQQASNAATAARDNLPGAVTQILAAIEAIPAGPGGGVSKDDVKQAVKDALKEGIS